MDSIDLDSDHFEEDSISKSSIDVDHNLILGKIEVQRV